MSVTLIFLAALAAIIVWWLSQQRLMAKPWLEEGGIADFPGTGAMQMPAAKIGLRVFLAVVGALFALLISAYLMRRDAGPDWRALPTPAALWINTGVLLLSSVALQWARISARNDDTDTMRSALLLGGASALAFLLGQILVWRQLAAAGYLLATNPANTFFYLLTALHGLHVIGGVVALGGAIVGVWRGAAEARVKLNVELCATYWHFLFVLWLILLALLMRWVDDFVDICRQLLT